MEIFEKYNFNKAFLDVNLYELSSLLNLINTFDSDLPGHWNYILTIVLSNLYFYNYIFVSHIL